MPEVGVKLRANERGVCEDVAAEKAEAAESRLSWGKMSGFTRGC